MAYINTTTNHYPVSEQDIRNLFPNTSFPKVFQAPEGYENVFISPKPEYDINTQVVVEIVPTLSARDDWEQTWSVISRFQEYTDGDSVVHTIAEQESAALASAEQIKKDANVTRAKQLLLESDFSALVDVRLDLQNVSEFDTYRSTLRQIIIDSPLVVESWETIPTAVWGV
jgi:hypothetical protein